MAEEVVIRLSGKPDDAIRAIAEVKAALDSLRNQTVKVNVEQGKTATTATAAAKAERDLAKATGEKTKVSRTAMRQDQITSQALEDRIQVTRRVTKATQDEIRQIAARNDARLKEDARIKEQNALQRVGMALARDRNAAYAEHEARSRQFVQNTDRETSSIERQFKALSRFLGVGHSGGGPFRNLARGFGFDPGGRGLRPRTAAIGAGVVAAGSLLGPLGDLLGLVGAGPAGAAGIGGIVASFKALRLDDVSKAFTKIQTAQQKLAAGTIKHKDYVNALINAQAGLTDQQKKALPLLEQYHKLTTEISDNISHEMLPAIGSFSRALQANRGTIAGFFGASSAQVAGGIRAAGGFLRSRPGQQGVRALAGSGLQAESAMIATANAGLRVFLAVATAAQPMVAKLSADVTGMFQSLASWTQSSQGQKSLGDWFNRAEKSAVSFSHVIYNLGRAIFSISQGSDKVGTSLLGWLDKATNTMANFLASSRGQRDIGQIFDQLAQAARAAAPFVVSIAHAFAMWAPVMQAVTKSAIDLANALGHITPGGLDTLAAIYIGSRVLPGGGLLKKGAGRLGGSLLSRFGTSAATNMAPNLLTGGAVAAGGAAGVGLGGAALATGIGAAVVGLGVGLVLLEKWSSKTADASDHFKQIAKSEAATNELLASRAALAAQSLAMRQRASDITTPGGDITQAKLSLAQVRQQRTLDMRSLRQINHELKTNRDASGAKLSASDRKDLRQQKTILTYQIQVDDKAVRDALAEIRALKQEAGVKTAASRNIQANLHDESNRGVVDSQINNLKKLKASTDAAVQSQDRLAHPKGGGRLAINPAAQAAVFQNYIKNLQGIIKATKGSDDVTATWAQHALDLAKNLGRIPKSKQVDITISLNATGNALFNKLVAARGVGWATQFMNAHGPPVSAEGGPRGGKYSRASFLVGEENRPEWVIATNPAYRDQNIQHWMSAGKDLGIPGFAKGGKHGVGGGALGYVLNEAERYPKHASVRSMLANMAKQSAANRKNKSSDWTVPGADAFDMLIADVEGQEAWAQASGKTGVYNRLVKDEMMDVKARIRSLVGFLNARGVRKNRHMFSLASQELSGRYSDLSNLGQGSGSSSSADQLAEIKALLQENLKEKAISGYEQSVVNQFLKGYVGSFAKGTDFVQQTGFAKVHRGERISWGASGGGSMVIEGKLTGEGPITNMIAAQVNTIIGKQTRSALRDRRR